MIITTSHQPLFKHNTSIIIIALLELEKILKTKKSRHTPLVFVVSKIIILNHFLIPFDNLTRNLEEHYSLQK